MGAEVLHDLQLLHRFQALLTRSPKGMPALEILIKEELIKLFRMDFDFRK